MNTALPNSVRNIELDVTEIIQMLAALSDRFKNQFLLKITDEDVKMIQKRMVEQTFHRIIESVKRSQVIEYPDQLPPLVLISRRDLKIKRVELKSRARLLKYDLIELDRPDENQQDPDSSDSINDVFEEMGCYESRIIAGVLSPPPEPLDNDDKNLAYCCYLDQTENKIGSFNRQFV
ncbi:uncharacterized protein EV154DRAFT_489137 [Mucor mucedo]|uniref:uncharacterized protein n=1 Tax=Mucor mucedo TaxID=29922 RepID=UPI00221EEE05|nr:uncharacterized protein EV154DRAFT_489137 [Mucor mucedo]KAI7862920.1 hypothetical protein EV154DRAFT_489137 [Mucor mucedo]